jgi:hypothetical protein
MLKITASWTTLGGDPQENSGREIDYYNVMADLRGALLTFEAFQTTDWVQHWKPLRLVTKETVTLTNDFHFTLKTPAPDRLVIQCPAEGYVQPPFESEDFGPGGLPEKNY